MMPPGTFIRKLRTLRRMTPERRRLLLEAAWSLLGARVWIALVPIDRITRRLGVFVSPTDRRVARCRSGGQPDQAMTAAAIGWAVGRVASLVPFRAVCLQQAMAARAMLRRRGIASVLHFGAVKQGETRLDAHAWLDAAGVPVIGYPLDPALTELGCLV